MTQPFQGVTLSFPSYQLLNPKPSRSDIYQYMGFNASLWQDVTQKMCTWMQWIFLEPDNLKKKTCFTLVLTIHVFVTTEFPKLRILGSTIYLPKLTQFLNFAHSTVRVPTSWSLPRVMKIHIILQYLIAFNSFFFYRDIIGSCSSDNMSQSHWQL